MIMKKIQILLVVILFISVTANADDGAIRYVTEEYPPYNYSDNGKLKGMSVDVLEAMYAIAGTDLDASQIKILPWQRAYKTAQKKPNFALFSTTRTIGRENDFHWVGPIVATSIVILTSSNDIEVNSLADLYSYKIGVVRKDIGEESLLEMGFPKESLYVSDDARKLIEKLSTGELNFIAYEENVARWWITQAGYEQKAFKSVYKLADGQLYFSFNRKIQLSKIETLQSALMALKAKGSGNMQSQYQQIYNKYF
ncbi:transporter substrate-binding domain-containing protein [Vibrio coralliilyticus]|nr:transporter substrate-binding domain-containing protein [Vibrio coralliilyticus]